MNPRTLSVIMLFSGAYSVNLHAQAPAPTSAAADGETITLDAFKVIDSEASGYGATASSTATRMNIPIRDVPQTVNVVNSKFLEDTASFDTMDAVRYVPNVARRTANHQPNQFIMRGFVTNAVFLDGFRIGETNRDTANFQRIEVIKGPASASVGRGEVGGVISYITKQPLSTPQQLLEVTAGSYNLIRIVGDTTGPIGTSGALKYRLIGLYHDADDIKPYAHTSKRALYPTLEWKISDKNDLTVALTTFHTSAPMNSGRSFITSKLPGNSPGLPDMPTRRDFQKAEPWDRRLDDLNAVIAKLITKVNDTFSARQAIQLSDIDTDVNWALGGVRDTIDPVTGDILIGRTARVTRTNIKAYRYQGDGLAQYKVAGGSYQTLLGLELAHERNNTFGMEGALASINYTHPVYNSFPTGLAVVANTTAINTTDSFGLIAQHQANYLKDRLNFIAGVRADYVRTVTDYQADPRPNLITPYGKPTISPRYGVTITPIQPLSFYAVYSVDDQPVVISPRYNLLPAGDPRLLETLSGARTGKLKEFGIKGEFFNGRVSATFASYQMTRANAVISEVKTLPNGSAYNEFSLSQGDYVKGVEAQVFGSISSRLDFQASYVNTPKATTILGTGKTNLPAIPKDEMSIFASYNFFDHGKSGFSVRAGYNHIGKMWGHINDYWRFGPQHRADAGVSYTSGKYAIDLQVNNVFDDDYIPSTVASDNLAETPPRMFIVTARRRF